MYSSLCLAPLRRNPQLEWTDEGMQKGGEPAEAPCAEKVEEGDPEGFGGQGGNWQPLRCAELDGHPQKQT